MVNVSNGHESTSSNKRYRRSQRVINVPCFPVFTGRGQNQNLENHEEAYLEPGEIEENREEWVIAIKDKMKQTLREDATTSWDKLCIYRVPHYLQENDKKSYFPQTVSLGPYHHGKIHLMPMEHHKWRAVNKVMKRNKQQIEMYIDAMKQLEEKSRACYQGAIYMSSNKFTQMLVLDGCFVLELFRGTVDGFPEIGYVLLPKFSGL
ncbi:hypothetical protein IGI04_007726 [Brassica rapa subsp. trilocularis]|uniref:Uncharacterized protein n=1 Tax=Brassica rapa subsp. trilocularis TaxID=1813537 RepID=A0ABQ7NKJ4_BRACM|nr:hypothetical protein IGI04_007726 [Brassica rapa subsp. trilocularis]